MSKVAVGVARQGSKRSRPAAGDYEVHGKKEPDDETATPKFELNISLLSSFYLSFGNIVHTINTNRDWRTYTCMKEMRLLTCISQMLEKESCSLCGLWIWRKGWASMGKCCILCWSLARGTLPGPKGAADGEVLNHNQHILDTFISCCGPDPLAGLSLFFMNSNRQQKQNVTMTQTGVLSRRGIGQEFLQEDPWLDLPDQRKFFKRNHKAWRLECVLKQHFENNRKFLFSNMKLKQHWKHGLK